MAHARCLISERLNAATKSIILSSAQGTDSSSHRADRGLTGHHASQPRVNMCSFLLHEIAVHIGPMLHTVNHKSCRLLQEPRGMNS